jgi:hypothetical protein
MPATSISALDITTVAAIARITAAGAEALSPSCVPAVAMPLTMCSAAVPTPGLRVFWRFNKGKAN